MERARILVVEDEGIVAMDLETRLISLGHDVTAVVSSGEEAVAKAIETSPDLVLMDIMLKGQMDGVEAALQIRDHLNIPVIYLLKILFFIISQINCYSFFFQSQFLYQNSCND